MNFDELNISKYIKKAIKDMRFQEMTPIQEYSIPHLLENKDVIGQAKTGTGKTAAFAIPAIENIDDDIKKTQVLILSPTRELAMQICGELRKFTKYTQGVACEVVYGGEPIDRQIRNLRKKPAIVIGTPGRVLDHINRRVLRLNTIKTVVLDEADEMLNMGFRGDIEKILNQTPSDRQTVLFSATMPPEVLQLAKTYQKDPIDIKIKSDELTVNNIEQYYVDLPKNAKVTALEALIQKYDPKRALVFCNTKRQVDKLLAYFQSKSFAVDGLHGDMTQRVRTNVMAKFKRGEINILIATDVAARGIDVKDIEIVFNYDIPSDMDFYIHRIGRTARAGKSGLSITFSCGKDQLHNIFAIERFTNSKINPMNVPDVSIDSRTHSDGVSMRPKRNKYQQVNVNSGKSGKDNSFKDKSRKSSPQKDALKKDALMKDVLQKDVLKKDSSNKESSKKEYSKKDSSKKDPSKKIPVKSASINHAKRETLPKPKNTASKITLDEYFKKSDEINTHSSNNISLPAKNVSTSGVKKNINKIRSRSKYNGYTGRV